MNSERLGGDPGLAPTPDPEAAASSTSSSQFCASWGTNPESFEANVARYFWDLYDTRTIDDNWFLGGADVSSHSIAEIFGMWDRFPSIPNSDPRCAPGAPFEPGCCSTSNCSGDREAGERTAANPDGRNLWDYLWHAYEWWSFEMYVNCVEGQVP